MLTKKEIRQQILKKRRAMSEEAVQQFSQIICNRIKEIEEYISAENICLYMPIDNEVDITLLSQDAWENGKSLWLPKTSGENMDFLKFDHETSFVAGAYGIMEPVSDEIFDLKAAGNKTLILMPGVAFSQRGDRIGYGGGYYDRYLSDVTGNITTIAVCYDFQVIEELPHEAHDIRPKMIISESNCIVPES